MSNLVPEYKVYVDWTGHGGLYFGPAGWWKLTSGITFASASVSDEQPFRGSKTLKSVTNASQNPGWARSFKARAGVPTTVHVWVYNPGDKTQAKVTAFKPTGNVVASTTTTDAWVELTITINEAVDTVVGIIVDTFGAGAGTWYLGPAYVRTDMDDVSCDVFATRTPVDTTFGRDAARDLSAIAASEVDLELDNATGNYTPTNPDSILNRWVTTQHQVLITASTEDEDYILFTGWTDEFSLDSSLAKQSITFKCIDMIGYLNTLTVTTAQFESIRTGDAFLEIMKAAGLTTTLSTLFSSLNSWNLFNPLLDHGVTTLSWWSFNGTAKEAFDSLLQSEGAPAYYTIGLGGQIEFKDRHHRNRPDSAAAEYTVYGCLPDSPASTDIELDESSSLDYGYSSYSNKVVATTNFSAPSADIGTVWTDPQTTRTITGEVLIDEIVPAFNEVITPVGATRVLSNNIDDDDESDVVIDIVPSEYDFIMESGTVTPTLLVSSGTRLKLKLVANGTAVISGLQVRGRVIDKTTRTYTTNHAGSQTYFSRVVETELDTGQASPEDSIAMSEWYLKNNYAPRPTATLVVSNLTEDAMAMILRTGMSTRFNVTVQPWYETGTTYVVEAVNNNVQQLGHEHVGTFQVQREENLGISQKTFKFGVAGQGFGVGVFGQFASAGFVFGSGRFGIDVFGFNARTDKPFIIGTSALNGTDEIWY